MLTLPYSPSKLYDLLMDASTAMPIAENYEGSYLTFKSINGLVFAIDLLVAGFSTVWLDQVSLSRLQSWTMILTKNRHTGNALLLLGQKHQSKLISLEVLPGMAYRLASLPSWASDVPL